MSGQPEQEAFLGLRYYGEQSLEGVDLSLIRQNGKLTPLERIRKADRMRRSALKLLEYGRQRRENTVPEED